MTEASFATPRIGAIHHVTAISADAARTRAFYEDALGLRLVKRTVNYDEPSVWHLYFGNAEGSPGSLLTFFPFDHAAPARRGAGEIGEIAFAAPLGALDFWRNRLDRAGVRTRDMTRFGESGLAFDDPDGLPLELVERPFEGRPWTAGGVGPSHAIRGVLGVALTLDETGATESLMTLRFGYARAGVEADAEGERIRLMHPSGGLGAHVDLLPRPGFGRGRSGAGGVHHVAFRAPDAAAQKAARESLLADGLDVTETRDRTYFQSIYFREPGGVLFEIATDGPGFSVDEASGALGRRLALPSRLEPRREEIERALPLLEAPASVG